MTEQLTLNRSDWSGRTATIDVDREANTFHLNGQDFTMSFEQRFDENDGPLLELWRVRCDDYGPHELATAYRYYDSRFGWCQWQATAVGITRTDDDPVVALVQVLFMTL